MKGCSGQDAARTAAWARGRRPSARLIAALALLPLAAVQAAAQPPGATPAASPPLRPPYLQRGDEVEQRYRAYRERLARFFERLGERLDQRAPSLRASIAPPAPVRPGYQVLPAIIPDRPRPARRSRVIVSTFSWSRTDALIDREHARLDALERRLPEDDRLPGEGDRVYDTLVDEYKALLAGQKLLESTIHYNRLWQGEIVRFPRIYRDLTDLHEAALKRQALLDAIPDAGGRTEESLRARAEAISRRLEAAIRKLPTPDFVRVEHPSASRWIVEVPVYTDIADAAFVERFRTVVEDAWQVRDGEDRFTLTLEIRRVSPDTLYADGAGPAPGARLDLADHLRRFPPGAVVLTTGATTTHASGRSIILGPHGIGPATLVHEFGHMLGFKDAYFRGYRDRGADGYEVIEVILDPDEVVSTPERARVRREHFQQVVDEKRR